MFQLLPSCSERLRRTGDGRLRRAVAGLVRIAAEVFASGRLLKPEAVPVRRDEVAAPEGMAAAVSEVHRVDLVPAHFEVLHRVRAGNLSGPIASAVAMDEKDHRKLG